jgi:hypothetical protein
VEKGARDGTTSAERSHPRAQLGESEGLGQVVVCPGIEPLNAQLDLRAGGQDQDRDGAFTTPQVSTQLEARAVGQPQVEHQQVNPRGDGVARVQQSPGRRDVMPIALEGHPPGLACRGAGRNAPQQGRPTQFHANKTLIEPARRRIAQIGDHHRSKLSGRGWHLTRLDGFFPGAFAQRNCVAQPNASERLPSEPCTRSHVLEHSRICDWLSVYRQPSLQLSSRLWPINS